MKDFETDELLKIELIREKFHQIAKLFSFKLMDPSPIELLSTLEVKSGSAIREEIYFFKDKGDRNVALRFDFTVGLTRYITSQQSYKLPAKFASFGGVFRYDEPQKGRYRFFHQWNIEIFGKPSLESEAEIMDFTSKLFASLGLKIEIQINHRKLVESFICNNYPHSEPKQQEKLFNDSFRLVDKISKKSRKELLDEYKHMPPQFVQNILDLASISGTPKEIESKIDVDILESWDYLKQLWSALQNRNVNNIKINFGIVRGLDYYSGTVFEVFDITSKMGALAGGGRYDTLTKAFGRDDLSATGVAGGVERMILVMNEQKITQNILQEKISVLYVDKKTQKYAMNIASQLRAKNIPVDIDLSGRPLKKQMESATDSKFTIIIGPKELEQDQVILRDMRHRSESLIKIKDLLDDPDNLIM